MPIPSQFAHRNVTSTALAYKTNVSPTDTSPSFVNGSQNILTSIAGYAERRPGFSLNMEATPTIFNNLQRLFSWDRFDGTFIEMACDINASNQAVVYKRIVGTDASFVSIFTDNSANVFDFIVSNNQVYFSNGNSAKKYDPVNGVTNWGIAIGSINGATGPNGVGTGTDVVFGSAWANPGNITANDGNFATVTLTQGSNLTAGPNGFGTQSAGGDWTIGGGIASNSNPGGTTVSSALLNTNFGFSIPSTATINGITVSITRKDNPAGQCVDDSIKLLKAGVPVGTDHASVAFWPGTFTAATYGSSSDLWGTTWTASDINNPNFGVQILVEQLNASVTASVSTVTITITYTPAAGALYSDYLQGTNTSLSIGSTNQVLGILVEVKGFQSVANANTQLQVQLIKGGNLSGTVKTGTNLPLSNGFVSFGGNSDLWGTTWSANDINQTSFGASLQAVSNSAGSVSWSVDFVRITVYSSGGPVISVSGSAGSFSATTGYQYVFCYGNSNTGHISSPTPVSASTGVFSNKLNVQISLTASTDAQVNQIRLFRSTDSVAVGAIGGTFFELPNSPFANTTANVTDNAADTALNIFSIAPFPTFNDPPPACHQPVYFAGRVWMYTNNQVFFSALEECINGVPEESFPSGKAGNFWNFDQPVQGLAVAGTGLSQTLMIFCAGRIYGITGSSLDTFRRFLISNRRGTRSQNTVTSLGGMVAWFDSSSTVWATDGQSLQELSVDIRPDISGTVPNGISFTFHVSGRFHWLVCGFKSKIIVFDLDTQQWMPPWTVGNNYVTSVETSAGNYNLLLATSPKALMLNQAGTAGTFNDNGSTFQPILVTANHSVVPDFGRRFSYNSLGLYDEPSRTGAGWYVQSDTNSTNTFGDVGILIDDDPLNTSSIFRSIFTNAVTPQVAWKRNQGKFLIQNIFAIPRDAAVGRWYALKFTFNNADQVDRIYDWFLAYTQIR